MKNVLVALGLVLSVVAYGVSAVEAKTHAHTKAVATPTPTMAPSAPASSYQAVQPLDLLKNPDQWLGKKVRFEDTFITFSPYALDYKPAMRSSKDYIAFLVRRPDVTLHIIPLSEMKLIYARKKADKVLDLESGDTVAVQGKVFSTALGDPWLDVDDLLLIKKSPENEAKAAKLKKAAKK